MAKKDDFLARVKATTNRAIDKKNKPNPHLKDTVLGRKTATVNNISKILLEKIEPNPDNPRFDFNENRLQELAESIKAHGIIQPITVKKIAGNKFQIISGERRYRAAKIASLKEIPAYTIEIDEDLTSLELALIENIQREDLSPIEAAISYKRLMDEFNWTQEELAGRIKKGRITITHTLGTLTLPQTIIDALRKRETTLGHVKGLLSFRGKVDYQLDLFRKIQERKLTVREAEELIREYKENLKKGGKAPHKHQDFIDESVQELKAFFGAKAVKLNVNSRFKGKLIIPIEKLSDFEFILKQIRDEDE